MIARGLAFGLAVGVPLLLAVVIRLRFPSTVARLRPDVTVLVRRGAVGICLALSFVLGLSTLGYVVPAIVFTGAGLIVANAMGTVTGGLFSGVWLLGENTFQIGDEVVIGAYRGRVVDITLRLTVLRGANGRVTKIPNAVVMSSAVTVIDSYDHRPIPANRPPAPGGTKS